MPEEELLLQYRRVEECIRQMEESTQRLQKLGGDELASSLAGIRKNWTGENAEAYLNKCSMLGQKIQASARALQETAESMQNEVETLRKADSEAAMRLSEE